MKKLPKLIGILLSNLILLSSCQEEGEPDLPQNKLYAKAGADQEVDLPATIQYIIDPHRIKR